MPWRTLAIVVLVAAIAGCARPLTTRERTTLGGAAIGAGSGALIGGAAGDAGAGAIIGGAVGALGGAIVGNEIERDRYEDRYYDYDDDRYYDRRGSYYDDGYYDDRRYYDERRRHFDGY
jgi:uncharacterized protein YcfJ